MDYFVGSLGLCFPRRKIYESFYCKNIFKVECMCVMCVNALVYIETYILMPYQ